MVQIADGELLYPLVPCVALRFTMSDLSMTLFIASTNYSLLLLHAEVRVLRPAGATATTLTRSIDKADSELFRFCNEVRG